MLNLRICYTETFFLLVTTLHYIDLLFGKNVHCPTKWQKYQLIPPLTAKNCNLRLWITYKKPDSGCVYVEQTCDATLVG